MLTNIDHVMVSNSPILINYEQLWKPIKNIDNIDSFKQIELELKDFQYHQVPLMSPMFITIKVKQCENLKMRLIE